MGDSDDEYDRRGRGRDKFRRERSDFGGTGVGGGGASSDRAPGINSSSVGGASGGVSRRDDWPDRGDSGSGNLGGGGSTAPGSLSGGGGGSSLSGGGWTSSSSLNRDRLGGGNQSSGGRRDYRDNYASYQMGGRSSYGSSRNDSRYSPADRSGDMSPPAKRIRSRDWDDRYPNYELGGGHYGSGGGSGHHRDSWSSSHDRSLGGAGGSDRGDRDRGGDEEQYQPPMLTLKQFLHDQDDHIDEQTLLHKYQEYKADFRKKQIQEFFNRHKDEEWFRCKYFPDEIEKRKERQETIYQRRQAVFMALFEQKYVDSCTLDVDQSDQIVRVLDAAVIKLEGGSDFDLKSLDETVEESLLPNKKEGSSIFAVESSGTSKATGVVVEPKNLDLLKTENAAKQETADEQKALDSGMEDESGEIKEPTSVDDADLVKKEEPESDVQMDTDAPASAASPTPEEAPASAKSPEIANEESNDGELIEEGEEPADEKSKFDDDEPGAVASPKNQEPPKPRPLHKTCSIFFRNLAPTITKQEIEDECKKFPGFLRLALSEPQMDRRFNRRGWATFERTVNIREICWALNSVKIRGTEIGPIVNRDLTRRIRSVNGISSHKSVVRADIRHAAKLIMKLDAEKGLWKEDEESQQATNGNSGPIVVPSRNPLLKNITDYLIEEASAEEEELLGGTVDLDLGNGITSGGDSEEGAVATNGNGEKSADGNTLERDEELIKVLDRLLFYLRIVHSTDYYNHSEYPSEDEMPNRIGLIHARGLLSSARVPLSEIQDYIRDQETRVAPLLAPTTVLTPEEVRKLGSKNLDEAVEAFIKENTKELGEGKWLCPLSNKKFMGPEFVRKHILNKHIERVDQVKQEAVYFNNYVLDPKRPQLPEHPFNQPRGSQQQSNSSGSGYRDGGSSGGYRDGYRNSGDMHGGLYSSGGGHQRQYGPGGRYQLHPPQDYYNRGFKRSRYRDLDAPLDD